MVVVLKCSVRSMPHLSCGCGGEGYEIMEFILTKIRLPFYSKTEFSYIPMGVNRNPLMQSCEKPPNTERLPSN